MTSLRDQPLQPTAGDTSRLRVLFLMDVLDDHQERFLAAYEGIRNQVEDVPGHISDQLCQSLGNSAQWLITSEWQSSEHFLAWVDSRREDPLFRQVSKNLSPFVSAYDPDTWRAPSDAMAQAFYRWQSPDQV